MPEPGVNVQCPAGRDLRRARYLAVALAPRLLSAPLLPDHVAVRRGVVRKKKKKEPPVEDDEPGNRWSGLELE